MLLNKNEIRTLALLEAVRFCGGEELLAALIKVHRSTINKWINQPKRKIPYRKAVLIEKYTGVSIERLCPNDTEENEYLRERAKQNRLMIRSIPKDNIIIKDSFSLPYLKVNRPIIIGSDGVLISGLAAFHAQQTAATELIRVAVLDLEALLLDKLSVAALPLVITERVAAGLRLRQLIGDRQGSRNGSSPPKKEQNQAELRSNWNEVEGRTDSYIAKKMGLKSQGNYIRAEKVYFRGIPELTDAMDELSISISAAFEIAKLPKKQQMERLCSKKRELSHG